MTAVVDQVLPGAAGKIDQAIGSQCAGTIAAVEDARVDDAAADFKCSTA